MGPDNDRYERRYIERRRVYDLWAANDPAADAEQASLTEARTFLEGFPPIPALKDGEFLMQTVFLSLDPYMRGRMSDGPSYALT